MTARAALEAARVELEAEAPTGEALDPVEAGVEAARTTNREGKGRAGGKGADRAAHRRPDGRDRCAGKGG
jgi:hypothetical protein